MKVEAPGPRVLMPALVYEAPRVMTMRDLPVPIPQPDEVLIEVEYSGICGSELSGFLGQSSIRQPPLVFGHEISGRIVALGSDIDSSWGISIGDEVTANPLVSCGRCDLCAQGRQQLCPRRLLLGASLPGGNARYVAVPASAVLPVPAGMTLAVAAMVEPVAFALRAVEVSSAAPDSAVLVVGAGAIGLFILQVLAASGVRTRYVVERNPDRLAMAVALGCIPLDPGDRGLRAVVSEATGGQGVDVAIDAVGTTATRRECLLSLAPGGTMVLVGLHSDETELPLNTAVRQELVIRGAFAYSPVHFRRGLAWLADGTVGLQQGVVVARLDEGQRWYEQLVSGHPASKVLLRPAPSGG
ncbi:MAG: alcohol dehydrogenase catalytic domain-containing protein [Actinomycetales bacterium]|nr:alcohol dehydrogenase catalytic domain-containing protein [Actinomycetales bacterium]